MSRLDQHIRLVRNKMALDTWLRALAWAGIAFFAAVTVAIIVQRSIAHYLPHPAIWFWGTLGACVIASIAFAILRRPTEHQAAMAIDEKLALKEKFSTALFIRPSKDPFALAAVRDAEKTADNVSLHRRFPLQFPRSGMGTAGMAFVLLLAWWLMPPLDLFGARQAQAAKVADKQAQVAKAEQDVKRAIIALESASKEVANDEQIKLAGPELHDLARHIPADPARASKVAQDTLKEIETIKQKIKDEKQFATAANEMKMYRDMSAPSPDEVGPVADAHRAIAKGNLDEAVSDLKKAVDNFDKMDKAQQEKTAEQMQKLAQQIQQQANNPQTQQQIQQQMQQQLQQAGMSQQQAQQQAQQMQQLMQQAANGNQQAAQQLQKMANQAIQQANQQQGQSQQQQKQNAQNIQQAMQQAQQQANAQANAQAMQQAAQNLAQAMKQAGQQAQSGQQGKQGGQNGQGQQQQMAQAAQAMQQQMQQLQAQANGAAGVKAGQQGGGGNAGQQANAGQGAQQGGNNGQWGQGQGQGQQGGQGQGQGQPGGQWRPGDPQKQNGPGGQGGAAIADGGKRPNPVENPFGVKQELSNSQTNDTGKILASSYVKAPAEKGSSKMSLSQVAESEMKEATDEVQQDRIPRGAWKAVKGYFDTLKNDQPSK